MAELSLSVQAQIPDPQGMGSRPNSHSRPLGWFPCANALNGLPAVQKDGDPGYKEAHTYNKCMCICFNMYLRICIYTYIHVYIYMNNVYIYIFVYSYGHTHHTPLGSGGL